MMKLLTTFLTTLSFTLTMGQVSAEEQPLRMVAYNIHAGRGTDGKLDIKRIAKVIEALKPDLVALQEEDKNCRRSGKQDMAAKLAEFLKMEYRFGKAIDLQGGEYGLAVLSRLPIEESKVHKLPLGNEARIGLEVVVTHSGKRLSFVSLHLERNSQKICKQQVKALMDAVSDRKHPVILAGDFNAARDSEPMKLLSDGGWNVLEKNDGKSIRTFHGEKKRKDSKTAARVEIDFMAIRGLTLKNYQHGVIPELVASDHRPVYLYLK